MLFASSSENPRRELNGFLKSCEIIEKNLSFAALLFLSSSEYSISFSSAIFLLVMSVKVPTILILPCPFFTNEPLDCAHALKNYLFLLPCVQ